LLLMGMEGTVEWYASSAGGSPAEQQERRTEAAAAAGKGELLLVMGVRGAHAHARQASAKLNCPKASAADKTALLRKVFATIDKNKDGVLSRAEVIFGLRKNRALADLLLLYVHPAAHVLDPRLSARARVFVFMRSAVGQPERARVRLRYVTTVHTDHPFPLYVPPVPHFRPANIRQEDGSRDEFERVFQAMDEDDSKQLDWEEFKTYFLGLQGVDWTAVGGKKPKAGALEHDKSGWLEPCSGCKLWLTKHTS
jgi:hypothetical protein